ncbi:MAG: adenylate/guanylate cyclase domain-containing protein [Chitinophagales bacterium]
MNYLDSVRDWVWMQNIYFDLQWSYGNLGADQMAAQYLFRGLQSSLKHQDTASISTNYFMLGNRYRFINNYSKALDYYLLSNRYRQYADSMGSAIGYAMCSNVALAMGDIENAGKYIEKAEPLINSQVLYQPFYYYINYGKWLLAKGDLSKAKTALELACHWCIKGNQRYQKPLALSALATVYRKENQPLQAEALLNEATQIAEEENNIRSQYGAWKALADFYEWNHRPKDALAAFKRAQIFADSINQAERAGALLTSELQQEFDHLQAERAREQQQKDFESVEKMKQQRYIAIAAFAGFLAALIIGLLIYRSYQLQRRANKLITKEKERSEELLLNILPEEVANELKSRGAAEARYFDEVTVFFSDFKSFTTVSEQLTPQELVSELHQCFSAFDAIISKYSIEKIKTVGDAYLCVAGLPRANPHHASDMVRAALEIQQFMANRKQQNAHRNGLYDIRIGINSGAVVAGIVGVKKFAYDIWGDSVNVAARMEQNGHPGKVNISEATYTYVKDQFTCSYRGEIEAKNKGRLKMYFVELEKSSDGKI